MGRVTSPLLGRGAGGRSPATYAASIGGLGPNAVSLVSEREERWHTFEAEYLARGLQFAALRFGARVHAHAPSGHSPSRQVRPATLVRHVVAGTVRGYEVFDEETLFALLATAQRVLAKSAHISRQPPASRRPPAFRDTRALLMASQDIALWVPAGSNRCRQLPVGHSNCRMSSPSRHSTFVGW